MSKYRTELTHKEACMTYQDKEVFPIYVPSYKRKNAPLLRRCLDKPWIKIVVCVREEEYEEYYAEFGDRYEYRKLKGVTNISETRQQLIEIAYKEDKQKNIFMFDDDISGLKYLIPSETPSGALSMRNSHLYTHSFVDMADVLKMWMLELSRIKEVAISSVLMRQHSWHIKNKDKEITFNSGECIIAVHLNLDVIFKNKIKYKSYEEAGVEDYNFQIQCMEKGLRTVQFTDYAYETSSAGSLKGGCTDPNEPIKEKWERLTEYAKNYYGEDHPGVRFTVTRSTGLHTIKLNHKYWSELYKKNEEANNE